MFAIEYKNEIWREDAACAELGVPTGIFFSEDLGDIARAKRICADCPSLKFWQINAEEEGHVKSPDQKTNFQSYLYLFICSRPSVLLDDGPKIGVTL